MDPCFCGPDARFLVPERELGWYIGVRRSVAIFDALSMLCDRTVLLGKSFREYILHVI
jgi:hypothetical protein